MARIYPDTNPTTEGQTTEKQGAEFVAKTINPKGGAKSYLRWIRTDSKKGTYKTGTTRRVNCQSEKGRTRAGMKRVPALSPYCADIGKEYPGSESPPRMYVVKKDGDRHGWILAPGQRRSRSGKRGDRKSPRESAKNYSVGTQVGDHVVGTYIKKDGGTSQRWYTVSAYTKRLEKGKDTAPIRSGGGGASAAPASTIPAAPPTPPAPRARERATRGRKSRKGGAAATAMSEANRPGNPDDPNFVIGNIYAGRVMPETRWALFEKKGGGGRYWRRYPNSAQVS